MDWQNRVLLDKTIKESKTYTEVLRKLGLNPQGSNIRTLKKYISKYGISADHFDPSEARKRKPKVFAKDILNRETCTASLRRCILRENLLEYKCSICGLDSWLGKKLSLSLDHINGDRKNNQLSNLRWLCPNCDSQQTTYRGRNKRGIAQR